MGKSVILCVACIQHRGKYETQRSQLFTAVTLSLIFLFGLLCREYTQQLLHHPYNSLPRAIDTQVLHNTKCWITLR